MRTYVLNEPFLYYEGNRFTLTKRFEWGQLDVVVRLSEDRKLTLEGLSIDVDQTWGDVDLRFPVIDITTRAKDGSRDLPKLDALTLTVDGKPTPLYGGSRGGHLELLADVTITGTLTLRGLEQEEVRPAAKYEVIDALLPHGADREKRLQAELGKDGAAKLSRWNDFLANFEWVPRKVKPGDEIRVYFPSQLSPATVLVNGTVVPDNPGEVIRLPKPTDDTPLLRVRVGINPHGSVIPEGVTNVLILRPTAGKN
jgi:hypothetical protein